MDKKDIWGRMKDWRWVRYVKHSHEKGQFMITVALEHRENKISQPFSYTLSEIFKLSRETVKSILREASEKFNVKLEDYDYFNYAKDKEEVKKVTDRLEKAIMYIMERCNQEGLNEWLWDVAVFEPSLGKFVPCKTTQTTS